MAKLFVLASLLVLAAGEHNSQLERQSVQEFISAYAAPGAIKHGQTDSLTIVCEYDQLARDDLTTVTIMTISAEIPGQPGQFETLVRANTLFEVGVTERMKVINAAANANFNFGRHSELVLKWDSPRLEDARVYQCEVHAVNRQGVRVESTKTVEVKVAGEHVDDIRDRVDSLEQRLQHLRSEIHQLGDETSQQFQKFSQMVRSNIESLQRDLDNLKIKVQVSAQRGFDMAPLLNMLASDFHVSQLKDGTRYLLSKGEKPFSIAQAHTECASFGGYLVEIGDMREFDFILDLIKKFGGSSEHFFTGAHASQPGANSWVYHRSQRPVAYLPWAPGMEGRQSPDEDCLVIKKGNSGYASQLCAMEGKFICEIPSLY